MKIKSFKTIAVVATVFFMTSLIIGTATNLTRREEIGIAIRNTYAENIKAASGIMITATLWTHGTRVFQYIHMATGPPLGIGIALAVPSAAICSVIAVVFYTLRNHIHLALQRLRLERTCLKLKCRITRFAHVAYQRLTAIKTKIVVAYHISTTGTKCMTTAIHAT